MTKFLPTSIEWTNARKAFLAERTKFDGMTPYEAYKIWLRQFGAVETLRAITVKNDVDAVAFKLRFGYTKQVRGSVI